MDPAFGIALFEPFHTLFAVKYIIVFAFKSYEVVAVVGVVADTSYDPACECSIRILACIDLFRHKTAFV